MDSVVIASFQVFALGFYLIASFLVFALGFYFGYGYCLESHTEIIRKHFVRKKRK